MTDPTPWTDEQIVASLRDLTPGFGTEEEAADRIEALAAALAAVTAERDHARESSDRYSTALGELREQAVMNETRLRKELDQARQMLADAPHDANTCATWWGPQSAVCTCWKAGL